MQEREFEGVSPASVDLVGQEPMWRDFALFDASVQRMTETILSDSYQARVMVGFKWAMDADSRQRVVRYLGHIVLMSLAEVAEVTPLENAELRLSYPMTLPEGGRAYEDLVTKDVTKRVGVDVRFYTESGATLNHFREQHVTRPTATLVLDIGGGSTDIALAAGNTRIWEHSVRLAGEDLMDTFLLYNRELLKDLGLDGLGADSGVFGDRLSREKFMQVGPDRVANPTDEERDVATTIINLSGDDAFEKLIGLPSVAAAVGGGRAAGKPVRAVFSEKPKHEAAQGMMAGEDARQTFELEVERVCGVAASLGETEIRPETVLDSGLIAAAPKERSSIEMDDFLAFLKRTGDRCGFSIALGTEAGPDIRRLGEAELDAFVDGHRVDPPFITMLRRTLQLLYHGDDVEVSWRDTQSSGPRGWFAATAIPSGSATPSASTPGARPPAGRVGFENA